MTPPTDAPPGAAPRKGRISRALIVGLYLVLVAASHLVIATREPRGFPQDVRHTELPVSLAKDGSPRPVRLAWREWDGPSATQRPAPVLLLHGAPGDSSNFSKLAPLLAAQGRRVIAMDLPGFGYSQLRVADHSHEAAARAVLALLNHLQVDRAHVVGWSNGGGAALELAHAHPERVASVTLLASIGVQELEGTGSYAFEHFKYRVAYALMALPELAPHFGVLGTFDQRVGWVRNFADSDQRRLRPIMQELVTPTLILHGRHDPLALARVAEESHRLIQPSTLHMTPFSHFMPFMQPDATAAYIGEFTARHDDPGAAALRATIDEAPVPVRDGFDGVMDDVRAVARDMPWWAVTLATVALSLVSIGVSVVLLGLLVVSLSVDPALAIFALCVAMGVQSIVPCVLARLFGLRISTWPFIGSRWPRTSATDWRRRLLTRPFREGFRTMFIPPLRVRATLGAGLALAPSWRLGLFLAGRVAALAPFVIVSFATVVFVEVLLVREVREWLGLAGVAYTLVKLLIVANAAPLLLTREGRLHLRAGVRRLTHHEYWPTWAFYGPLVPAAFWLTRLRRPVPLKLIDFTRVNPGIENGGGLIDERKSAIMAMLPPGEHVARTLLIPAGAAPGARAEALVQMVARELGYDWRREGRKLVLKPDRGQRGYAVRVVADPAEAERYFEAMTADAIAQPFIEGPHECGILWMRQESPPPGQIGIIHSITRKTFPTVVGDGRRTLEELIYAHPRHRAQASVFLDRFLDQLSSVPDRGEVVRLSNSGNHCQGTLFADGSDLITPELCRTIDAIASRIEGFDLGRFDVRYRDDDALRRGEGFVILELNGTSSEPTHMYDPTRNVLWSWSVLLGFWREFARLAAWRAQQGSPALTWREVRTLRRRHAQGQRGGSLAD